MYKEIKQLIPCTCDLYALYEYDETGEISRKKVLAFALCDDGCIYPQVFDRLLGIGFDWSTHIDYELGERKSDRIAEALELINDNLEEISLSLNGIDNNLNGCISRNGNNKYICVTGNITSY